MGKTVNDNFEITNQDGKYCRWDIKGVTKDNITIRKVE